MNETASEAAPEAAFKIKKMREYMNEHHIQALRLKGVDWFSWATCGGRSTVIFTNETGVAEVFVTLQKACVLTNKIEQERLAQEEVPPEFEIIAFPWEQPSLLEKFVQQNSHGICYSDRPWGNEELLPESFRRLRLLLGIEEIKRYREVGRKAAEAMTEAIRKAEPDWSENQLAGEGAKALWARGLDPALVMVGSHRRCLIHRHPIAGSEKLGDSAMMVFCARGFGLYANLTRFIFFRPLTDEEENKFAVTLAVEAAAFQASVPGKTLPELYKDLAAAYRGLDCASEIERHHQGGPTGYLSREYVVSPESSSQVKLAEGMALAWNPSLPGAKTEDTVLMNDKGLEILTADPAWPTISFAGRSRPRAWVKIRAQAHGRVNLIGEHTDYNGGWVLPTTIPQKTTVTLSRRADQKVSASSTNLEEGGGRESCYTLGEEIPTKTWMDYLQGVTKILGQEGHNISGFNLQVDSTIPVGSGLSSSAALEVSVLKALREAFALNLSDIEIARIGQRVENEFVGARVGIMDQMACCLAKEGEALFLDTKTLAYQHIPLCLDKMDLLVINSGVAHEHAGGEYNQRRSECEEACVRLKVHDLRELTVADLPKLEELPPVLKRRARHVITENQRVHLAVEALLKGDVMRLGELFYESHLSMAQDYEVSIPEIDTLVKLCREQSAVYGARLTGGGFGGSIVSITKPGSSHSVGELVTQQYYERTGIRAKVLVG